MKTDEAATSRFKIGAVARLTGVPVETLRVWERRYQVVTPHRTAGGSRLYNSQDVARLTLIRRLIDAGDAISAIAQLSLEQLEERESASGALQGSRIAQGPARIAVIGSTLPLRLNQSRDPVDTDLVALAGSYANIEKFETEAAFDSVDALIVEEPVLIRESVNRLRRLQSATPPARVIVVYGCGKRESVRQLEGLGIRTLQYPVNWPELIRALDIGRTDPAPALAGDKHADIMASPLPKRRFDDSQLALAASVITDINCECPHQIADLLVSLNHFELYSAECENLSDDDAALHAYLHRVTAHARSLMESALQKVIETDGIELQESSFHAREPTLE